MIELKDINRVFGGVLILAKGSSKGKSLLWLVRCIYCGKQYESYSKTILQNKYGCYACSHSRKGVLSTSWRGGRHISSNFYNYLKKNAKRRNLDVTVDINDLDELLDNQDFKCAYTKEKLILSNDSENTASVDRIDSSIGYHKNNIQFVHKDINIMKWDMSQDNFFWWVDKIYNFQKTYDDSENELKLVLKHPNWRGGDYVPLFFFSQFQRGAKRRNIKFSLTIDYLDLLWEQQRGICAYSGEKISFGISKKLVTASIDRIDPSMPYINENVHFVHNKVNAMKWAFSEKKFLRIINNLKEKNID